MFLCYAPVVHAQHPAVIRLIKNATTLPEVSQEVVQKVFQATRMQFPGPASALTTVPRSIVQITLPIQITRPTQVPRVQRMALGSGFLLRSHGKLWVAGAYHVMGGEGSRRMIRMQDARGNIREHEITVTAGGVSGWHSPDISLAEISPDVLVEGMKPLEIATPDMTKPAYSFGYTAGGLAPSDFLAVERRINNVQDNGMLTTFQIPGSSWETPVTGNGFCGSPIVQASEQDGEWKAVGLHDGHCLDLDEPELGQGSGVNLARVVPFMLDSYFCDHIPASRSLTFRGWEVARLQFLERVEKIQVWRNDNMIFERILKNYPNPYENSFAEQALENFDVHTGDKIVFHVVNPRAMPGNLRQYDVLFTIP